MKRKRSVLIFTLAKNKIAFFLFAVMTLLNGAVFCLYDILTEAFFYSEVMILVILAVFLGMDFLAELKKAGERENAEKSILTAAFQAADDRNLADRDYGAMILLLQEEIRRLQSEFGRRQQEDDDYYTAWVHQIKTPIAVMKLELAEDTEENRALLAELFRIEQYVEMVLDYVRLGSESHDLVIREYELDAIIRESLRKFAPQFVLRRLKLQYEPAETTVITDKKWLSFILEQLISNAVKYTQTGGITIVSENNQIRVTDTGIGIAAEDLPRIFEKGYTGMNGRIGQKSSGLGLFLAKKAADLIGARLSCESKVGVGSSFYLDLPQKPGRQTEEKTEIEKMLL